MKQLLWFCAAAAAFLALGELSNALACPMCREAVDQSIGQEAAAMRNGLASGFAFSIYFMLAVPYLLIGSFAFAVWRNVRRVQTTKRTRS